MPVSILAHDARALDGIHARLEDRGLLPADHLLDGGYMTVALRDQVARDHQVKLVGPVKPKATRIPRSGALFDRDKFAIEWKRRVVTCPTGNISGNWATSVSITPYIMVKFDKYQCGPCPLKTQCIRAPARGITFLPQELHELEAEARAEQKTKPWLAGHAMRSGVESTINEFVNGHGMRQIRYRSQDKAHVQSVLTRIAVNIERIDAFDPAEPDRGKRLPTALQDFLDWQRIPRPKSWRSAG